MSAAAIIERAGPRLVRGFPDWEVEEAFPYLLTYREGARSLTLGAELGAAPGPSILLFHGATERWSPPHEHETLDNVGLHRMLVRITAAMGLLGIRADWQAMPETAERRDWPVIRAEAGALCRRAE